MKPIFIYFLLMVSLACQADASNQVGENFIKNVNQLDNSPFNDFGSMVAGKKGGWADIIISRPSAFHALRSEPRVSFTLYMPSGFLENPKEYKLLVAVHGSGRTAAKYRDAFADFADEHKFVVIAPLFPIGIYGNGYADGYKFLKERDTRYDQLLLDMVADLNEACRCDLGKFYLFGFSGGGQFAHRFAYLHPDKLQAVSIGAPGLATKLDDTKPWPFGTADTDKRLGSAIDIDALRKLPIQIIVGDQDNKDFQMPEKFKLVAEKLFGKYGSNRLENMKLLQENYVSNGLDSRLEIVKGVGHEGAKMARNVEGFFLMVRQILNEAPK